MTDRLDVNHPRADEPTVDDRPDDASAFDVVAREGSADDERDERDDWVVGLAPVDGGGGEAPPAAIQRALRRAMRRPVAWMDRPWPTDRVVRVFLTAASLVVTTVIMLNVVHLGPTPSKDLIFDDTTPTGGDFGAHVWGPAYLRDHLLPSFRLNGWSMDWYAGLPTYRFYMVLPALLILLVNTVLPYGVAMKLVSVLGVVTMPASCWAFGRLARFRYPMPELFAFAGLVFVLDESFQIYGGNLKSTMAGEFSFSIALSLAILALGVLARGLETGRYRVWAAVLIAAAMVSHGIVLLFVAGAAVVLGAVWADPKRLVYWATTFGTALLLTAWWVGPFLLGHSYMTDMKYGGEPGQGSFDSWWDMFFPLTAPLDFLIMTFAVIGFAASIARRHLNGAALGVIAIFLWISVYLARDSLPFIGLLWNPRILPFLYLVRYLLMMVGIVESFTLLWNAFLDRRSQAEPNVWASTSIAAVTSIAVLVVLGFMYQSLPGGRTVADAEGKARYEWGVDLSDYHLGTWVARATPTNSKAVADGWARYNFLGYEGRGSEYTEYHQVVTTMAAVGEQRGCGRALWENHKDNAEYGTPMALMLLPFWTDGCIGSMEGLFFEASGTTPYHFLSAAAMSEQSSNPVRELRYVNNDAALGVRHLQDLGVRYTLVRSAAAKAQADAQPELTRVAEAYPWVVYEVAGSDVVEPLTVQPVVVAHRGGDQRERNLEVGSSWFQHPEDWAAMPADGGPDEWQHVEVAADESRREENRVDIVRPVEQIQPVELPAVQVSNIDMREQSLAFDVDRPGVPVLVKVSYFPNWQADGADGPWRIGPNMMVVVPTSTHVELRYGRSGVDYATILLTIVGIGACVLMRRRGDMEFASDRPEWTPAGDRSRRDVGDDALDRDGDVGTARWSADADDGFGAAGAVEPRDDEQRRAWGHDPDGWADSRGWADELGDGDRTVGDDAGPEELGDDAGAPGSSPGPPSR